MHVWALTGGIACGKSTVLEMLRCAGARVRSADDDARQAFSEDAVRDALRGLFPGAVDGDRIDRAAIAAAVFGDARRRKQLEAVVHPAVRRRMRDAIDRARSEVSGEILVYEVPLLFEGGLENWFDGVVVVDSPLAARLDRLRERARSSGRPDDGESRIAAQMPLEAKVARADEVVRNRTHVADLETEVLGLIGRWKARGIRIGNDVKA